MTLWNYWARLERIIDADTFDVTVDLGFGIYLRVRLRLFGIDAPEVYGVAHDSKEYAKGLEAREYVRDWVARNATYTEKDRAPWFQIRSFDGNKLKGGKFGRWLALIYAGGRVLNDDLVESGHAVRS